MPQRFKKCDSQKEDGRVKLPKEKYPEVIEMYERVRSSRKVGKYYGVDKTIILMIVNPEYKARHIEYGKSIQHWKQYYNKDKHREYQARYKTKKRLLKRNATNIIRGVKRNEKGDIIRIDLKRLLPIYKEREDIKNFLNR